MHGNSIMMYKAHLQILECQQQIEMMWKSDRVKDNFSISKTSVFYHWFIAKSKTILLGMSGICDNRATLRTLYK
jgi:hypothetical protein